MIVFHGDALPGKLFHTVKILFRLSILVLYLTGTANLSRNFFRLPDQSHRFPVQDADRQGDQADK
jgi:hypothetical protein